MEEEKDLARMVAVFRTTIQTEIDVDSVKQLLDGFTPFGSWNFDLSDCDRILRIENCAVTIETVMREISAAGFQCEELAD
jgi:hypothetical protein